MLAPLKPLPVRLLCALDILVVNEAEARAILGLDATGSDGLLLAT